MKYTCLSYDIEISAIGPDDPSAMDNLVVQALITSVIFSFTLTLIEAQCKYNLTCLEHNGN